MGAKKDLEKRIKELEDLVYVMQLDQNKLASQVVTLSGQMVKLAQLLKDRGVL